MSFKVLNNVTGWFVFLIAAVTYGLTAESTASFWDCGEFIACAYKLQVPHPPGAPLFLLIGRLFSFLALGDVTRVAYWINMSSAITSAFTILFLFWSITLIARKITPFDKIGEYSLGKTLAIVGSGLIGSLAYTFSDSFWFSAVESEVYAMSSFFTAFVFWAMLKWEAQADEEGADRWIILIAYMMGLSIGVHLLNLVTFPALAFIYYFKRYNYSVKGILATLGISGVLIVLVMNGVITGLPSIAGKFEVLFVNNFGLPFGSGIVFFILLFVSALVYGIVYSIKKNKVLLNTALLSFAFIIIGYMCYAIILIRSQYNTPIDENNPEDIISFVSYLKREQYGERPLVFGPNYTAELTDQKQGDPLYRKGKEKYEIYDYKTINEFDPKKQTLFPRAHSRQPGHQEAYESWMGIRKGKSPTLGDNIYFFFKYQLGHMYFRYFMWNFSGRAGDIQDASWLGMFDNDEGLPELITHSKARNKFYMLPFALGLLGIFFHYSKSRKSILVLGMLFFLTGIALILYLNPPPIEPRERDYIFVGSFYAFAIWIGLGVLALCEYLDNIIKNGVARAAISTTVCLLIPGLMLADGWDDHDRSNRWHSVDSAKNLLNSCAQNAIVFTGGDNDTFPLWYVQEVEGFRTDVRVCNLSLLNTDWYIQQMKEKAYLSQPLPITLEFENFIQGKNDYLPFVENPQGKNGISLPVYIDLVKQQHPAVSVPASNGSTLTTLPSEILILPVDKEKVGNMSFIDPSKRQLIPNQIVWRIGRNALEKKDLIMLDMIAKNNFERPIYFSTTLAGSNYLNLKEYMQMEGLAMRLMPYKIEGATEGFVNTDIMYQRMIKEMYWRGLDDSTKYYDENYRRFPLNARKSFFTLAYELMIEGKDEKAKEVINFCFTKIPDKSFSYDPYSAQFIGLLLRLKEDKKALEMCAIMAKRADEELTYYKKANIRNEMDTQSNLFILNQIVVSLRESGKTELSNQYEAIFKKHMPNY